MESTRDSSRLLVVQYGGDYREAFKRFAAGGEETYYAQRYSVDAVAKLGERFDEVATLCCVCSEPYNELLENGVRAIGAGPQLATSGRSLVKIVKQYEPTHLVIRTPIRAILQLATRKKISTIAVLADSFSSEGLKSKIRNQRLASLLNDETVAWVGNHGTNASESLAGISVKPEKIVPWDWPHEKTPGLFSAKVFPTSKSVWEVLYVGTMVESKGFGDALRAVAILKSQGDRVLLRAIGTGDIEAYTKLARDLQIEDCVEFLGLRPNREIVPAMRAADTIIIPSRHEYPEGFPMTIYEALCSRTPIVASDHPMFARKLTDRVSALIFSSGSSEGLAGCLQTLKSSPELYTRLSLASQATWDQLQVPVKWAELLNAGLSDLPRDRQWLRDRSLAAIGDNLPGSSTSNKLI
ncbi:glycosyltransferase [Rubidibacter lacunae KORDI 51-2]|uniref:Glycosyltransferase n=1 Tax=Rubidibacter lacunae KORDI 51-2 TaxID=582515 RepID=U5DG90_9CHRO|nr:glycosyltransferase [Rubidibacter lacunae]ERN40586.1 glycosyltransferase [Rubidibacter lacunae KORDI 51-2]